MAPGLDITALAHESEAHHHDGPLPDDATLPVNPIKATPAKTPPYSATTVLDPSSVTTDFDALRFSAAASQQLLPTLLPYDIPLSTLLISSPYNAPGHYLPLPTLSTTSLILAKALTALKPLRPDYATAPFLSALDFPAVLTLIRRFSAEMNAPWKESSFYVVVFRSRLKPDIDSERLYELDAGSHREACESGGLLKYWFGKVDEGRRNLATCFWRTRKDAYLGGQGPWHKKARAAGKTLYEEIAFSTWRFTVTEGAGEVRLEEWREKFEKE
ncbi:hypothetical protein BU23DRAFT_537148 [Bimuria novae-zelandiae CBS 107.79]|uniref:Uncharacterized protein n=1 Tax=Bimuria novae-zelandiae CBS 107.79 TaxID=1447943 RepID=A0A6A5V266_9PLEO|nr:hypothetical protein BU23DRAFT_537148 [Bimuria novae-zelandiae CBS 107.79]